MLLLVCYSHYHVQREVKLNHQKHNGNYMCHQYNIKKLSVLRLLCISPNSLNGSVFGFVMKMFCVYCRGQTGFI